MSSSRLQVLADHRDALLLAERGALIHNIGKLSEEFLRYQAGEGGYENFHYKAIVGIVADLASAVSLSKQELLRLSAIGANGELTCALLSADQKKWLMARGLNLPAPLDDHPYALGDFIEFLAFGWYKPTKGGSPPRITLLFPSGSRATELLEAAHNAASGVEKEDVLDDEGRQTVWPLRYATAFGLEIQMEASLFKEWRSELLTALETEGRQRVLEQGALVLERAVADTRYPINEVRLSDLSFSVAGLFKSALAQVILAQTWTPRDGICWRLLRVNFDVLGLYAKAIKIADLLAYQDVVTQACATVKQLLEVEYPLGNEVYRDTTGIYFTYPDLDLFPELEEKIRATLEPELFPHVVVDPSRPLKDLLATSRQNAPRALAQPVRRGNASLDSWQADWDSFGGQAALCPVCRLRPMPERAEACEHCQKRRASRVDTWLANPQTTIWMDEIADRNDRVVLIVGSFGLDDWLSGDLVQTLLVKAGENDPGQCRPKNPSPARLRRVWETCQRFWKETVNDILLQHKYGDAVRCTRLIIVPDERTGWLENVPYDGTLNGQAVSLLWREAAKHFITISNIQLAAGAAKDVDELARNWQGQEIVVSDPGGKQPRRFKVQGVLPAMGAMGQYVPCLVPLASPDYFLALVPAADAPDLLAGIHGEYARQFGKVQNRLPLFLGLVFFQRKTPLAAVMDTARRMVGNGEWRMASDGWQVVQKSGNGKNVTLRLSRNEEVIEYTVPIVMGDETTLDVWYPYFFVEGDPGARPHRFQYNGRWLVHVKDLQAGDKVCVQPSRFAYLFLEHTGQRFRFDPERDVLLLGELARLTEMWQRMQALAKTGQLSLTTLHGIATLLETKAEMWGWPSLELHQLIETALQMAGLWNREKPQEATVKPDDVISGRFARCLELYLHILKQPLKEA